VEPLIVKEEGEDDVDAPGVVQPDQNPEDFTHLPDSDFPPARPSIEKIPPPDEVCRLFYCITKEPMGSTVLRVPNRVRV
jgi:hypothetical protein